MDSEKCLTVNDTIPEGAGRASVQQRPISELWVVLWKKIPHTEPFSLWMAKWPEPCTFWGRRAWKKYNSSYESKQRKKRGQPGCWEKLTKAARRFNVHVDWGKLRPNVALVLLTLMKLRGLPAAESGGLEEEQVSLFPLVCSQDQALQWFGQRFSTAVPLDPLDRHASSE